MKRLSDYLMEKEGDKQPKFIFSKQIEDSIEIAKKQAEDRAKMLKTNENYFSNILDHLKEIALKHKFEFIDAIFNPRDLTERELRLSVYFDLTDNALAKTTNDKLNVDRVGWWAAGLLEDFNKQEHIKLTLITSISDKDTLRQLLNHNLYLYGQMQVDYAKRGMNLANDLNL